MITGRWPGIRVSDSESDEFDSDDRDIFNFVISSPARLRVGLGVPGPGRLQRLGPFRQLQIHHDRIIRRRRLNDATMILTII